MVFKETELEKVVDCIKDQPHKFIRLVDDEGKVIISFNSSRQERIEHFNEKFVPFLTSNATAAGLYSIVGKHTGKSHFLILCQIDKTNGGEAPKPVTTMLSQNSLLQVQKSNANFQYIEENAKLRADNDILEYQLEVLEDQIEQLEARITELEKEITELEGKEKPLLSENAQILMEFAKPFLPMAQALGMGMMAKYMPQPQPDQQQPPPQYHQPYDNGATS
jgi:cell division protein FtsB